MSNVLLGWSLEEVAETVAGRLVGEATRPIAGVATDSRGAVEGALFVALVGFCPLYTVAGINTRKLS